MPHLIIADAYRASILPLPVDDSAPLPSGARLQPLARPWAARLPRLAALLRRMQVQARYLLADDAPLTPLELAQALAYGLPHVADDPACILWAAFETGAVGVPCAWFTPYQWLLGIDHALLADPAALALPSEQAHALREAVAPLLAETGITLLADPTPQPPYL